jgi:hypothetical protein
MEEGVYRENPNHRFPGALRMQYPVPRLVDSESVEVHKIHGSRQISRLGWLAQGKMVVFSSTAVTKRCRLGRAGETLFLNH